ncbi:hypothetical protein A2U01_0055956, partial [Trifolium medium]|nr:hypothetical protein [Trifolium medium]
PEKETQTNEEGKTEETKEKTQETKEVSANEDNPTPTAFQKDLVDSHLHTEITKESETQAQPSDQQVGDPSPQKDTGETQPDPDQNKPEVEVSTVDEEKTPVQVEFHGASVIEATLQGPLQDMAQHDVTIADAPTAERKG